MKDFRPVFRESHEYRKKKLFDQICSFVIDRPWSELIPEEKIKTMVSSRYNVPISNIDVVRLDENRYKITISKIWNQFDFIEVEK